MANEGEILGVVDLGSNSFHLAIIQEDNGRLVVIDRIKFMVQLAYGLTEDKQILPEFRERALNCLAQFGERLSGLNRKNIRVVGTNTLRLLKDKSFIKEAEARLGTTIDIISGKEEARLIYLGVIQYIDFICDRVLVIDIGGGSTEIILGSKSKIIESASLEIGCVSLSKRFFSDDKISKKNIRAAEFYIEHELLPIHALIKGDLCQVLGASGTIQSLQEMIVQENLSEEYVTYESLVQLLKRFTSLGSAKAIAYRFDVSMERARVICAGLLILKYLLKLLNISQLQAVDTALREGVLLDLLGRIHKEDMRDLTIESLVHRFGANLDHAKRVETTALYMANKIILEDNLATAPLRYLTWASLLHEIGLSISYHRYYRHSAYLVEHADLDGFSRQDQKILARILYNHKRTINLDDFEYLPPFALILSLILRFSVLLHRSREPFPLPEFDFSYEKQTLKFKFPHGWLDAHPLVHQDFIEETRWLKEADFKIHWE